MLAMVPVTIQAARLESALLAAGLRGSALRWVGGDVDTARWKQEEGNSAMSAEKTQNVQDVFLNHCRKNKVAVTIFLINGVKLQGVIASFDNFCLLLRRDGHVQLVYKHAVSTVMPATVIRLYEPSSESEEADSS
jgi:host factor-I protein